MSSAQRGGNMRINVQNEDIYGSNVRHRQTATQYDNHQQQQRRKNKGRRKHTSPGPSNGGGYNNNNNNNINYGKMQQYSQSQYDQQYDDQRRSQRQQNQHTRTRTQDRDRRGKKQPRAVSADPPLAENSTDEDEDQDYQGSDISDDDYDNPNQNSKQNRQQQAHNRVESIDQPYQYDSDNEEELQKKLLEDFKKKKRQKEKAQQQAAQQQQQQQAQQQQRSKKKGKGKKKKIKSKTPDPQDNYNDDYGDNITSPTKNRGNGNRDRNRNSHQTQRTRERNDPNGNKRTARKSRSRTRVVGDNDSQNTDNLDVSSNSGQVTPLSPSDNDHVPRRRQRNQPSRSNPNVAAKGGRSYTVDDPNAVNNLNGRFNPNSVSSDTSNEEYGQNIARPNNGRGNLGLNNYNKIARNDPKQSSLIYNPQAGRKNTYSNYSSNMNNVRDRHSASSNRRRNRTDADQRRQTMDVDSRRRRGSKGKNRGQHQNQNSQNNYDDYDDEYDVIATPNVQGYGSPMAQMGDLGALPQDQTRVLKSPEPHNLQTPTNDDKRGRSRSREKRRNNNIDPNNPNDPNNNDYRMTQSGGMRDENNHARRRRRSASKSATPMPKDKQQGGLTPGRGSRGKVQGSKNRSKSKKNKESKLNRGKLAEDYWIKEKMGKGNFAVVRRAIRKSDNREFAAKIISKKHLSNREIAELDNEVDILCKLYHPNVVEVVEVLDTPRHLYIVLELLTGGELFDRIVQKGRFTEQQAANITKQLASALKYLHGIRIVHRDLKPENIIYKTPSDDALIKITDFGLGRDMGQDPKESGYRKTLNTACGTPGYVAPEILKAHPYDEYVDLWSCGVILYIMLCGYPPFTGGRNQNKLYRKIKRGEYSFPSPAWDNVSAMAKDCVKSLLTVDPRNRMSAAELRDHPWVQNTDLHRGKNLVNEEFAANLTHYLHKKRLRRGVELVIILNRMIRAAGLEKVAKAQRQEFREKVKLHKEKVKQEKRDELEGYRQKGLISDRDYAKLDNMKTPPIDYSKI